MYPKTILTVFNFCVLKYLKIKSFCFSKLLFWTFIFFEFFYFYDFSFCFFFPHILTLFLNGISFVFVTYTHIPLLNLKIKTHFFFSFELYYFYSILFGGICSLIFLLLTFYAIIPIQFYRLLIVINHLTQFHNYSLLFLSIQYLFSFYLLSTYFSPIFLMSLLNPLEY